MQRPVDQSERHRADLVPFRRERQRPRGSRAGRLTCSGSAGGWPAREPALPTQLDERQVHEPRHASRHEQRPRRPTSGCHGRARRRAGRPSSGPVRPRRRRRRGRGRRAARPPRHRARCGRSWPRAAARRSRHAPTVAGRAVAGRVVAAGARRAAYGRMYAVTTATTGVLRVLAPRDLPQVPGAARPRPRRALLRLLARADQRPRLAGGSAASSGAGRRTACSPRCSTSAPTSCRSRPRPRRGAAFADRCRRIGRRCSSIVGPVDEVARPVVDAAPTRGARRARSARHQPLMVIEGRRAPSSPRPAGAPRPRGRDRPAAAGVRRDVHRGGRRLAARRRSGRGLPRPRRRARPPRPRLRPHRRGPRRLQGRGRRRRATACARCRACGSRRSSAGWASALAGHVGRRRSSRAATTRRS